MKKDKTKLVSLDIEGVGFMCRAGIVPHLDYPVLIGRDCSLSTLLLKEAQQGGARDYLPETKWKVLPLGEGVLAHLTDQDHS